MCVLLSDTSLTWFWCWESLTRPLHHRHIRESRITRTSIHFGAFRGKVSQGTILRLFERLPVVPDLVMKLGISDTTHTHFLLQTSSTWRGLSSLITVSHRNHASFIYPDPLWIILSHSPLPSEHSIKRSMFWSAHRRSMQKVLPARFPTSQILFSRVTSDRIAIRMSCNVCYHSCLRCSQQMDFD